MKTFFFLFLFSASLIYSQELTADSKTLLLLHFNGNANGEQGETPTTNTNVTYETGVYGQGVYFGNGAQLFYPSANNINSTVGTIEFWIKPKWADNDGNEKKVLNFGIGGGMFLSISMAGTRLNFNRWGLGGNPELGVNANLSNTWHTNEWHYVAFTWDNQKLKCYVDGALKAEVNVTFPLPTINEQNFQIGAAGNSEYLDAVLDEFRISNDARTEEEIQSDYIKGLSISSLALSFRYEKMLVTWIQTPIVTANVNGSEYVVPFSSISPSVSDNSIAFFNSDNKLVALKAGKVTVSVTLNNITASKEVEVIIPARQPEVEAIDSYLSTPADNSKYIMPVVIVRYMPTKDGVNLDNIKAGWTSTINALKNRIDIFNKRIKFMLEEGSRFRGYKNSAAPPSLGYKVLYMITIYEEYQLDKEVPWNKGHYFPDYNQIMSRINAKNFVENLGVREFWIWGWHTDESEQPESNMSSPITGDISNSSRFTDDLPVFDKTYMVYGYNFTRTESEAIENHMHQLEAILTHRDRTLFWDKFVGFSNGSITVPARCGWCHFPPNGVSDYDWANWNLVSSDIEDWKPDNTGERKMVNCETWCSLPRNWPDTSLSVNWRYNFASNWFLYWMQNMPGYANSIRYNDKWMTNWWEFTADWDKAINSNLGLYADTQTSIEDGKGEVPISFELSQNYPNPFNPTTIIKYELPANNFVNISIYDLLGRHIKTLVNEIKSAGTYDVDFDASNLSSGIYFYKIQAGNFTQTKKMVFIK